MRIVKTGRRNRLSWFRDSLPEGRLVLDASVLINLLGCGAANQVLGALTSPCLVEAKVFNEISKHPIPGLCHINELKALVSSGHIEQTQMTEGEYTSYLEMVQAPLGKRLDVGESATLAVAHSRGLSVVVDENKARAYARDHMPKVAVVSTLCLLISAAYRVRGDMPYVQELVTLARQNARMGVPKEEKPLLAQVLAIS